MPSKTCEYFACAKPVAASLGGQMRQIIEESATGLIYKPGDAQGLADIILKLSQDKELTQKMGTKARELALKIFSDKTFAEKLIEVTKN